MKFPSRGQQLLEQAPYSSPEIAHLVGTSKQRIHSTRLGQTRPNDELVALLEQHLHIPAIAWQDKPDTQPAKAIGQLAGMVAALEVIPPQDPADPEEAAYQAAYLADIPALGSIAALLADIKARRQATESTRDFASLAALQARLEKMQLDAGLKIYASIETFSKSAYYSHFLDTFFEVIEAFPDAKAAVLAKVKADNETR